MKAPLLYIVVLVVSAFAAEETPDPSPVINGHPLSFWLSTWVDRSSSPGQRIEAQRTFEQAGTNVIPYLLEQLVVGDEVSAHTDESDPDSIEKRRLAIERLIAAEAALRFMGARTVSAIPEYEHLLTSTNHGAAQAAAEILSDLGPHGTRILVDNLTSTNSVTREVIPGVLRDMASKNTRTNLFAEIPALFNSLDSLPMEKAFDCSAAIVRSVIWEFTFRLESTNAETRYVCARRLGQMGVSAQSAIPYLEKLRGDSDKSVRAVAAEALKNIRGEP